MSAIGCAPPSTKTSQSAAPAMAWNANAGSTGRRQTTQHQTDERCACCETGKQAVCHAGGPRSEPRPSPGEQQEALAAATLLKGNMHRRQGVAAKRRCTGLVRIAEAQGSAISETSRPKLETRAAVHELSQYRNQRWPLSRASGCSCRTDFRRDPRRGSRSCCDHRRRDSFP